MDLIAAGITSPRDSAQENAENKDSNAPNFTTVYMPNGQSMQRSPLSKKALQKHNVEKWAKFSSPVYDTVLMLEDYHLVKDKNTATFYLQDNRVKDPLDKLKPNVRRFERQNNRKQIETFYKCNDSRFEPIEKSPSNLTSVKKVTGLSFNGYKERNNLFPEKDQATFYNANKEVTMKGLKHGVLPWRKMTKREAAQPIKNEQPEDSYDHMKAIDYKTQRAKPKAVMLSNFEKSRARDDALFRTSDAFANVLLENTKEERELQI